VNFTNYFLKSFSCTNSVRFQTELWAHVATLGYLSWGPLALTKIGDYNKKTKTEILLA